MSDQPIKIIHAGIAVLREAGLAAFTQPRVSKRAGVRQSHVTYYFPTRQDLLVAVAREAMARQLDALDKSLSQAGTEIAGAVLALARVLTTPENNRVLLALAESADHEPRVRALFREFAEQIASRAARLLVRAGGEPTAPAIRAIHCTAVGIAVLSLALGGAGDESQAAETLTEILTALATKSVATVSH